MAKSTLASLLFKGLITKDRTVKWVTALSKWNCSLIVNITGLSSGVSAWADHCVMFFGNNFYRTPLHEHFQISPMPFTTGKIIFYALSSDYKSTVCCSLPKRVWSAHIISSYMHVCMTVFILSMKSLK